MAASKINAFGALPFDKQDSIYAVNLKDDFIAVTAVPDADPDIAFVSELPWLANLVTGDSVPNVTVIAGVANHPGIISLGTGATTPADGDVASLTLGGTAAADNIVLDTNGIYIAALIRIPQAVTVVKAEFGLLDAAAAVNSSAADLVSLVFDNEDAANVGDEMWFLQSNVGGVDTEAVFNTALYAANKWVLLEIAAASTGATGRVTTSVGSQVQAITGTLTTATLTPTLVVEAVGATEARVQIDAFQMRYLRRTESAAIGT